MFKAKNNHEVFNKILTFDVDFPSNMDPDCVDLVERLCDVNPNKRLGLNSMSLIKKHPYFKGVDFELINNQDLPCPECMEDNFF